MNSTRRTTTEAAGAQYATIETRGALGDQTRRGDYGERRAVVVIVDRDEAADAGWKPGYYLLPFSPEEAKSKLKG